MPKTTITIRWQEDCEKEDYPAALSYLSLIYSPKRARKLVVRLREQEVSEFKAKDIADGYHRLCAIYSFHEDAAVRCKIDSV